MAKTTDIELPAAVRRNIAATGMKVKQGEPRGSAVASVDVDSPDTVEVDDPARFAASKAQTLAHESTHLWQNNLPPAIQARIPADNPKDPYNFGGTAGLKAARAQGKTLLDFPRENQAAIVQYYTSQGGDESAPKAIRDVYKPFVDDMKDQKLSTIMPTQPGQEGIETAPRPPQGEMYDTETYAKGDPAPGDNPSYSASDVEFAPAAKTPSYSSADVEFAPAAKDDKAPTAYSSADVEYAQADQPAGAVGPLPGIPSLQVTMTTPSLGATLTGESKTAEPKEAFDYGGEGVSKAKEGLAQLSQAWGDDYSFNSQDAKIGLTKVIDGVMDAGGASMIGSASPMAIRALAAAVAGGYVTGEAARRVTKFLGLDPDSQDLARALGNVAGGSVGAGVAGYHPAEGVRPEYKVREEEEEAAPKKASVEVPEEKALPAPKPEPVTHPAGKVTGIDAESGLPIVDRSQPSEEVKAEPEKEAPAKKPTEPEKTSQPAETSQPEKTSQAQGEVLVPEKKVPKGEVAKAEPPTLEGKVGEEDPESGRIITQPVDKLAEAQKLATAAAPELKKKLGQITDSINGAEVDGVREEKDRDRALEKSKKQDQPVETISDLLAARIAVTSPQAKDDVVAALKDKYDVVKEEDRFEKGDPDYGFRSHDLQVQNSNGSTAEVQVVPKEIANAEKQTHENYEQGRKAELEGRTEDAKTAMAANRQIHDAAMDQFNQRQDAREAYGKFIEKVADRHAKESAGQDVLDRMDEAGESPSAVSDKFWADTYFKLPAAAQQRFTKMLKGVSGFEPGDTIAVRPDKSSIVAKDWQDVAKGMLPDKVEHLEGTERGLVALMKEANDRVAGNTPKAEKPLITIDNPATKSKTELTGGTEAAQPKQTSPLAKGSHVVLPDGRSAKVDYYDGKLTKKARVTTEDGKRIDSVPGKDLTPVQVQAQDPKAPWVGVDLDKTLAKYDTFKGPTEIGKPIPAMVDRIKQHIADGDNVRILTARVSKDPDGKIARAIQAWSQKNLGTALPVTDRKDEHMSRLYDDKAVAVEPNTGKILGGDAGPVEEPAKPAKEESTAKPAEEPAKELAKQPEKPAEEAKPTPAEQADRRAVAKKEAEKPAASIQKLTPPEEVKPGKNFEGRYLQAALEPVKEAWDEKLEGTPEVGFSKPQTKNGHKEFTAQLLTGVIPQPRLEIRETRDGYAVIFEDYHTPSGTKQPIKVSQTVASGLTMPAAKDVAESRLRSGNLVNSGEPFMAFGREVKGYKPDVNALAPAGFKAEKLFVKIPGDGQFTIPNNPAAIDGAIKKADKFAVPQERGPAPIRVPKAPAEFDVEKHITNLKRQIEEHETDLRKAERNPSAHMSVPFYKEQLDAARESLREAEEELKAPKKEPELTATLRGGFLDPELFKSLFPDIAERIKEWLSDDVTPGDKQREMMRQTRGEMDRRVAAVAQKLEPIRKSWMMRSRRDSMALWNAIENGTIASLPAKDQPLAKTLHSGYQPLIKEIQALKPEALQNLIQNYFPHIWERPASARKIIHQVLTGKRPFAGRASFLKQRTIPTMQDGIDLGLTPKSWNPVDQFLTKYAEMAQFLMGHQTLAMMKDAGTAKFVRVGQKPPDGWSQLDDRIGTVTSREDNGDLVIRGYYYAPPDAAKAFNNFVSRGMAGRSGIYDTLAWMNNNMNALQLGISAFHATTTSVNAATSEVALGIKQLSEGKPVKAAGHILSGATTVPSIVRTMVNGSRLMREYLTPGSYAKMAREASAIAEAGGRIKQNTLELKPFQKTVNAFRNGALAEGLSSIPATILHATVAPVMEYWVPRMKLGAFYDMAHDVLDQAHKNGYDAAETRRRMQQAWDSVDNRFGQIVYDNLFWHKGIRDALHLATRSVGWNYGDVRELGGGVTDTIKEANQALHGEAPEVTDRMAFAFALPLYTALVGAVLTYLWTGEKPDTWKDYFYPKRKDGTRVSIPGYMKDVIAFGEHPVGTVENKLAPIWQMTGEAINNRDFYGTEIRHLDDNPVKQFEEFAAWVASSVKPFAFQGTQKLLENKGEDTSFDWHNPVESAKKIGEAVARHPGDLAMGNTGFQPAPSYIQNSAALNMARDYERSNYTPGTKTQVEADHAKAMHAVEDQFRTKNVNKDTIRQMVKDGKLSEFDVFKAQMRAQQDPLKVAVRSLHTEQALNVYEAADDKEKQAIHSIVEHKVAQIPLEPNRELREKLTEAAQRIFGTHAAQPSTSIRRASGG